MMRLARRFLASRPLRKLRQNRTALAALAVILAYLAVGVACIAGLLSRQDTDERVGPNEVPGWLERPTLEQRLRYCRFFAERIESALRRADPKAALDELALAELRPADLPIAQLRSLVGDAGDLGDQMEGKIDRVDVAKNRLDNAARQHTAPAAPDAEEAKLEPGAPAIMTAADLARAQAAAETKLEELESLTRRLWPIPEGWNGRIYRARTLLGIDRQGRSISVRAIYSIRIALQVGLVVSLSAVVIGTLLGGAAAFFGGWVDHAVTWLYSTFSSIPELVLLSLLAYIFLGRQFSDELVPLYAALSLTFWIGPCRVIRGEVLKIKELEYVQAATAIGFGRLYILLRHVIPNTAHLMLINFSLLFIAAVKTEVILTFLGLGVKNGASWGIMIGQSRQEVLNGFYWQIGAATALMFVLVLAFNVVSDALQDAFDPRHVG